MRVEFYALFETFDALLPLFSLAKLVCYTYKVCFAVEGNLRDE